MPQYIDYITTADRSIIDNYDTMFNLYAGEHYKVFNINQYEYFTSPVQYIVYNFPAILTTTINDLIWNESPTITFKQQSNQDRFDEFIVADSLLTKLREATITSSYAGDAILKISVSNGKVSINQIDNKIWYPIFDTNNPRQEATGHILKYEKKIGKDDVCLLEIHTAGFVEYQAYVKRDKEYLPTDLSNWANELANIRIDGEMVKKGQYIYNTKCDYPLVCQLSNNKSSRSFFGQSDYNTSIISKVFAINSLLNQSQSVLRRHANPKMIVPKNLIKQAISEITTSNDKAIEFGLGSREQALSQYSQDKTILETIVASKIINKLEFFGSDINGSEPKYLTWDGNLDASDKQVKVLLSACFEESQLSKVLIDPSVATNLSGVAILKMSQQSLNKASKKQAYISDTVKKLLFTWCQLSKLTPEYPAIQFKDGLVADLAEEIKAQEGLLNLQLTTRVDAIMATRKMSQIQAQEALNAIEQESNLFTDNTAVNG